MTNLLLIIMLLIPLAAAGSIALAPRRRWIEAVHAVAVVGTLSAGLAVAAQVWSGVTLVALGGLLRADALSGLMIVVITLLEAVSGLYALGYMRSDFGNGHTPSPRTFFVLFHLFLLTMLLAVATDNLGVMWVAIEGTTLATVFLVNLHNTRASLEAGYKYLILSSVGIALAFLGTALMYYAGAGHAGEFAANWSTLRAAAAGLNPQIVRLAFVFILIGYGTKAGLAPMHTWLPDAHSEAPAPISALMSGVLLNVGLYALLRFKSIVDAVAGPDFAGHLLLGLGLLSVGVAAVFLLSPRNYKRMLAYSSVEHIGIICLGVGFGGYGGVFGALFHLMNHALTKSLLFITSGNILLKYRSTDIDEVRGLMATSPLTGSLLLVGTLALVGLPPFALFTSEFMIFRAGIESYPAVAVAGIFLLIVIFAGMLASVNAMLYGHAAQAMPRGDVLKWPLVPLAVNLVLLIALGLTLPSAVSRMLDQVLRVLGA